MSNDRMCEYPNYAGVKCSNPVDKQVGDRFYCSTHAACVQIVREHAEAGGFKQNEKIS